MALWDYLVVTASNAEQASAYVGQLSVRRELGLLSGAREVLVVADPGGKRVGSGGSTIFCLIEVIKQEINRKERRELKEEEGEGPIGNYELGIRNCEEPEEKSVRREFHAKTQRRKDEEDLENGHKERRELKGKRGIFHHEDMKGTKKSREKGEKNLKPHLLTASQPHY